MNYKDYIISDHRILLGKPVIKGTRLSVEMILRKLGEGATTADLITMYPNLDKESIQAVLQNAAEIVANEENLEQVS